MVDAEKRYVAKSWAMHYNTKVMKHCTCNAHLPRLKQVPERAVTIKHPLPRQLKRQTTMFLPTIVRNTTSGSPVATGTLITTNIGTPSPPPPPLIRYSSAVHEAAQRFILRNTTAKFSQESPSMHVTHSFYPKRTRLYDHIQAKINTGLPHLDNKQSPEPHTHQLEPLRPVDWSRLKREIEQDIHVRADSKRIQFNSGITYATQLTRLGILVRTKIKSHLSSPTGSGDERYKIVVHLIVFPTTTAGLHVASRCLWDARTDNSITIKLQGADCDILILAFLCYTELEAI